MTRIERLENELSQLYTKRRNAMERQDFIGINIVQKKIEEKLKEIKDAKEYEPKRLADVLSGKGEDAKNRIYKALIKISLAADYANECLENTKSIMKEYGLNDFTLRADVAELCKLSQKIASFVIIPGQKILTDMICDNEKFISACDQAADKHLYKTLKL